METNQGRLSTWLRSNIRIDQIVWCVHFSDFSLFINLRLPAPTVDFLFEQRFIVCVHQKASISSSLDTQCSSRDEGMMYTGSPCLGMLLARKWLTVWHYDPAHSRSLGGGCFNTTILILLIQTQHLSFYCETFAMQLFDSERKIMGWWISWYHITAVSHFWNYYLLRLSPPL